MRSFVRRARARRIRGETKWNRKKKWNKLCGVRHMRWYAVKVTPIAIKNYTLWSSAELKLSKSFWCLYEIESKTSDMCKLWRHGTARRGRPKRFVCLFFLYPRARITHAHMRGWYSKICFQLPRNMLVFSLHRLCCVVLWCFSFHILTANQRRSDEMRAKRKGMGKIVLVLLVWYACMRWWWSDMKCSALMLWNGRCCEDYKQ